MKISFQSIETKFTIVALVFFTDALSFSSLFNNSEGELTSAVITYSPLTPILSPLQHVIFLIAGFLIVARWRTTLRTLLRNKYLWLFITLILISSLWSAFPAFTQRRSLALLETIIFGIYLASRYTLKEQLRLTGLAIGIVAIMSLLFTLALPGRGIETGIHAGAWRGIFFHKNLFARLMVLGFLIFWFMKPQTRKGKYLVRAALVLSIGLIILSTSKTALAIVLVLMLTGHIFQIVFRWRPMVAIPMLATAILIVALGTVFLWINVETILQALGRDLTLSGRTVVWSALWDKIQERPWLGYGYMGFWHGTEGESAYVGKFIGNNYLPPHAHNGFLELMLAFGAVGTFLFILSCLSLLRRAIIAGYHRKNPEGLWSVHYLFFLFVYNFTESTLVQHNSIFWVLYLALALSELTPYSAVQRQEISPEKLTKWQNNHRRAIRWQK